MSDEIENYSGEESDYSDDNSDRDDDDDEEKVIPTIASKLKKPILANISDELDDDGGNPEDDIVLDDDDEDVVPDDDEDEDVEDVASDDEEEDEDGQTAGAGAGAKLKQKTPAVTTAAPLSLSDSDDGDDDDDDENDDSYLQKFNTEVNKNYIVDNHPECMINNYDEISAMARVIRDKNNNVIDDLHRTIPYLTKYEKARILGQRAKQINSGAKAFVKVPENIIDGYLVAELELMQKRIPFIIRRPIAGGGCEYWNLKDLEIIGF